MGSLGTFTDNITISLVITSIFIIFIVLISIVIFFENREPSKTAAWLLILIALPLVGFIFYIYFGQNFRKKRIFNKKDIINEKDLDRMIEFQFEKVQDANTFYDQDIYKHKKLISLLLQNSKAPFTINNNSEVLTNGRETFKAIFKAIHSAREHVHI